MPTKHLAGLSLGRPTWHSMREASQTAENTTGLVVAFGSPTCKVCTSAVQGYSQVVQVHADEVSSLWVTHIWSVERIGANYIYVYPLCGSSLLYRWWFPGVLRVLQSAGEDELVEMLTAERLCAVLRQA